MNTFNSSKYADLKITVVPFERAAAFAGDDPFSPLELFEDGTTRAQREPGVQALDAADLTRQAREHLAQGRIVEALIPALMASLASGPDAGNAPLVSECLERLGLGQMARQLEELAAQISPRDTGTDASRPTTFTLSRNT